MEWMKATRIAFHITLVISLTTTVFLIYVESYAASGTPHRLNARKIKVLNTRIRESDDNGYRLEGGAFSMSSELQIRGEPNALQTSQEVNHTIHILLNAYHRSGSSYTGHMLASQPRTFYFFEPFMKLYNFGHFIPGDQGCNDFTGICRKLIRSSDEIKPLKDYINSHNIKETDSFTDILFHVLLDIYNCHLNGADQLIQLGVTDWYSRDHWISFINCMRSGTRKGECFQHVINDCQESRVRVIKLIRLRLDTAAPLLKQDSFLTIVHLFRDPRGIICSRLVKTKWYPLYVRDRNYQPVLANARILCKRMLIDFESGRELAKAFPNRVKLIRYEDLNDNELLQSLGISSNSYSQKSSSKSHNEWTTLLDRTTLSIIDSVCSSVYKKLGYIQLDFESLRNKRPLKTFVPMPKLTS